MSWPALVLILGGTLFPISPQKEETTKARIHWEFSFALRAWYAEAGEVFSGRGLVRTSGEAFAPQLEFEALRHRLLIRLLYQFPTSFEGERLVNQGISDSRIERQDAEFALGWRLPTRELSRNIDMLSHLLLGYKSLELVRDDASTPVNDDFTRQYQGLFAGFTAILQGVFGRDYDWDLSLSAAFAYFDTEVHEVRVPTFSFTEPFEYRADGYFVDISFNIYLRQEVQWMIGFKLQDYRPRVASINVNTVIPGVGTVNRDIVPADFEANGLVTGFLWKF